MMQLRRTAATAQAYQIECELISPRRGRASCYPLLQRRRPGRGDLAARRRPGQPGRPDRGAGPRRAAARRHASASGPGSPASCSATARVSGVRTDQGDVEAEVVVNCAGQWAKQVGALGGVTVPLHSAEHFYVVTDQIDGVHRGPAGAARPRRLHLLQGGGRRPGRRRLRARGQAVGLARRAALPVRVPAAGGGLGPLLGADGQRAAPDPGAGARPGSGSSTTARRASPRTTSSSSARRRSCGTSSSAPASTRSASPRPAGQAWRWRSGSSTASRTPT